MGTALRKRSALSLAIGPACAACFDPEQPIHRSGCWNRACFSLLKRRQAHNSRKRTALLIRWIIVLALGRPTVQPSRRPVGYFLWATCDFGCANGCQPLAQSQSQSQCQSLLDDRRPARYQRASESFVGGSASAGTLSLTGSDHRPADSCLCQCWDVWAVQAGVGRSEAEAAGWLRRQRGSFGPRTEGIGRYTCCPGQSVIAGVSRVQVPSLYAPISS